MTKGKGNDMESRCPQAHHKVPLLFLSPVNEMLDSSLLRNASTPATSARVGVRSRSLNRIPSARTLGTSWKAADDIVNSDSGKFGDFGKV